MDCLHACVGVGGWSLLYGRWKWLLAQKTTAVQCSSFKGRSGRQDELRELVPFSFSVLVVMVVCRCVALID